VRRTRRPVGVSVVISLILLGTALAAALPVGRAASPPTGPLALDRDLLSNLSAPSVAPGGTSTLSFRVADPSWFGALSGLTLTLQLYALNGYPGDDVGSLPASNAPVLEGAGQSGSSVNVSIGSIAPGDYDLGSVSVATSDATPAGTYAIRTALAFVENSSAYVFESRGWFSESAWEAATGGPGGSGTVNASKLGVSGIVPETAVYVAPSGWPWAIGALLAAGFVLVGLGAWRYFRRGPGSRSGAANVEAPGATNAPSAFGNSRSSPGDSRSS
jgi:hypothetical protein